MASLAIRCPISGIVCLLLLVQTPILVILCPFPGCSDWLRDNYVRALPSERGLSTPPPIAERFRQQAAKDFHCAALEHHAEAIDYDEHRPEGEGEYQPPPAAISQKLPRTQMLPQHFIECWLENVAPDGGWKQVGRSCPNLMNRWRFVAMNFVREGVHSKHAFKIKQRCINFPQTRHPHY